MKSLRYPALALLLFVPAACGTTRSAAQVMPDAADAEQGIVGGTTTTAYPAVGLLYNTRSPATLAGSVCTATVIAPHTLLTAAHCVLAANAAGTGDLPQLAAPGNLLFYPVADARVVDTTQLVAATSISVPASLNFPRFIATMGTATYNSDDIALVTLAQAVAVTPLPVVARGLGSADVGTSVSLIGYGSTGPVAYSGPRQKRITGSRISGLTAALLLSGSASQGVCSGDSGGPVLQNGTIVGVTQAGQTSGPNGTGNCIGHDVFTRVDVWSGFVNDGIAADSANAAPFTAPAVAPAATPAAGTATGPADATGAVPSTGTIGVPADPSIDPSTVPASS